MSLSLNTAASDVSTQPTAKDATGPDELNLKPKAHRYNFLKVNEVSIVTEPAILSQEEADKGVGFPIVKFVENETMDLGDPAQIVAAQAPTLPEAVVAAAKIELKRALTQDEIQELVVVRMSSDTIVLTNPYKNPLDNDTLFYRLTYKTNDDDVVIVSRPSKYTVAFEKAAITASKVYEVVKELPMSQITGVEVGGQIVKITPIPGVEFEADGVVIFTCDAEGVLHAGEGYSIDDDGIVRKTSDIVVPDTPEDAEAAVETAKFYLTLDQVKALMGNSGESYSIRLTPDGQLELSGVNSVESALLASATSDEEKMGHGYDEDKKKPKKDGHEDEDKKKPKKMGHEDDEDEDKKKPKKDGHEEDDKKKPKKTADADLGDVELRLKQLEEELAKAKQKLAGSSTTDPEVAEDAIKFAGGYPVEKDHRPVDGKYQRGIFTRHIDKRLLDRGTRLQADLISG